MWAIVPAIPLSVPVLAESIPETVLKSVLELEQIPNGAEFDTEVSSTSSSMSQVTSVSQFTQHR